MNPVFWFIVFVIAVLAWFLLSKLFQPLGRYISRIVNDTVDIINDKEQEEGENGK